MSHELDKVLGVINVDLDGRFSFIRTQETNLGNFVADIILEHIRADCCLINSGGLRSDMIHLKGDFKVKDLKKILPFQDGNVMIEVKGKYFMMVHMVFRSFYLEAGTNYY